MLVAGRYRLDREIGSGGTATVWLAHDERDDVDCAVKLLRAGPGEAPNAQRRERLRAEASALKRLVHEGIVAVRDLGEQGDTDFIAMELVPGGSLADHLARQGPFVPSEAARLVAEILRALQFAHTQGIVHRDVKPHNVLLRDDGRAALCDFGIAKHDGMSRTRTGIALGSMSYMAPEQRLDARTAGPSADVYGAGCTLYALLTDETPVDLFLASESSPRWEGVPDVLRDVVRRATAAEPGHRYPDAEAMAAHLDTLLPGLAGLPSRPRAIARTGTAPPLPTRVDLPVRVRVEVDDDFPLARRRSPVAWLAGAILLTALVVVVAGQFAVQDWVRRNERVAAANVAPPPAIGLLLGRFRGRANGEEAALELTGTAEALRGIARVDLGGGHRVVVDLVGLYDERTGELALQDPQEVWSLSGRLDADGVLVADLRRVGTDPLPLRMVRTE